MKRENGCERRKRGGRMGGGGGAVNQLSSWIAV